MTTATETETITADVVPQHRRQRFLPKHFGQLMMTVEGSVYTHAGRLCDNYTGGYWDYVELSNGGGYLRPTPAERQWTVVQRGNGFVGSMSSDAFGITATLYALSHLSIHHQHHGDAERLTEHFHLLRDFAGWHPQADSIFQAID